MTVTVTIDSSQIRRFTQTGGDVNNDMGRRARRVETRAKMGAPVDTGRLRAAGEASESTTVDGAWEVTFPVQYALYVDQGTRYMPARPFLSDAVDAAVS